MKKSENRKQPVVIKVGVLIEHEGKLLLIKEYSAKLKGYRWNIVKGSFEPKTDPDFFTAAEREAKEEAGASIRLTHVSHISYLRIKKRAFIQVTFVAEPKQLKFSVASRKEQREREENIVDLRFFTKEELKRMKRDEFLGLRAHFAVLSWLKGERYPLSLVKTLQKP